jgi:hypothetical protein
MVCLWPGVRGGKDAVGDYQGEAKESVEICEICGYNFFEPGFPLPSTSSGQVRGNDKVKPAVKRRAKYSGFLRLNFL